jgi:hypothetical protein
MNEAVLNLASDSWPVVTAAALVPCGAGGLLAPPRGCAAAELCAARDQSPGIHRVGPEPASWSSILARTSLLES